MPGGHGLSRLADSSSINLDLLAAKPVAIYGTQGVAALFMPALLGTVADRWVNLERLFGICHILAAAALIWASAVSDFELMYWAMLLNALAFMPTLALSNSLSYTILEKDGFDIVKSFPPIRVWGTIGFILAMWFVDLAGWSLSPNMLFLSAGASFLLGLFSFTLPKCPPVQSNVRLNWTSALGLDALVLFKNRRMAIFFVFSMLLGAALQITNIFGEAFLHDFTATYPDSFGGNASRSVDVDIADLGNDFYSHYTILRATLRN